MKEWEKEEKRLAKRRGGARQPGSGSGWSKRNDVREEGVLWEQKTTGNRQFTVTEDVWEALRIHALMEGRIPALHITLGKNKRRLILIEEDDFDDRHSAAPPRQRTAPPQGHVQVKGSPAAFGRAPRDEVDGSG